MLEIQAKQFTVCVSNGCLELYLMHCFNALNYG